MQFITLIALLGSTKAVQIRDPATTATAATATGAYPAGAPENTTTSGPPMCTSANPPPMPSGFQCPAAMYADLVPGATPTDCTWQCIPDATTAAGATTTTGAYHPPSTADQIQQFVSGFFGQCDKNGDSYMSKKELKKCLQALNKQMKQGMKEGMKMQIQQIKEQNQNMYQFQKDQYEKIAKAVWNGASTQPGFMSADGMTQTEVVGWLSSGANWQTINNIMNTPPPASMGGPSGPPPPPAGSATGSGGNCGGSPATGPPQGLSCNPNSGDALNWGSQATGVCEWECVNADFTNFYPAYPAGSAPTAASTTTGTATGA